MRSQSAAATGSTPKAPFAANRLASVSGRPGAGSGYGTIRVSGNSVVKCSADGSPIWESAVARNVRSPTPGLRRRTVLGRR